MDSIYRPDFRRLLVIKDTAWKEATVDSIRPSPDWVMSCLRRRESLLNPSLKLDQCIPENDELMDLMSKVTGVRSVPDAFKWKDAGLKDLIAQSRPEKGAKWALQSPKRNCM